MRPPRRFLLAVLTALSLALASLGASPEKIPAYVAEDEPREPLVPGQEPVMRHDVYDLKSRLKDLGLYAGPVDEVYDAPAVEAVQELQRRYWLDDTGIVDDNTWRALGHGVERPERPAAGPPPAGTVSVEVDTEKLTLILLIDGTPWRTYPVAAGRWDTKSPVGEWRIVDKGYEAGGPFGARWMGLDVPWGNYGIHGTNMPWTIGGYFSIGCIRMFNEDVSEVFDLVPAGTLVKVAGYRPVLDFSQVLRPGSASPEVVALQEALRRMGFDAGRCDGRYGAVTQARVKEIALLYGLPSGDPGFPLILRLLGLR